MQQILVFLSLSLAATSLRVGGAPALQEGDPPPPLIYIWYGYPVDPSYFQEYYGDKKVDPVDNQDRALYTYRNSFQWEQCGNV